MKVLITAPNLNIHSNVSGIASVVRTIIQNNSTINYLHFTAGKEDTDRNFLKRIGMLVKSYALLIKILATNDIGLVHLNLPLNPKSIFREYVFFYVCRLFNRRILTHLHGGQYLLTKPKNWLLKNLIFQIYKGSDLIVCLSSIEKEIIKQQYLIDHIKVLENTVDEQYFGLEKKVESENQLTVLFLGRLHESKGVNILVASIKELMEKEFLQIHFVICGTGPLLAEVLKITAAYPLNVSYLGIVSGDAKLSIMSKSTLFVLPSLHGEGLPMSLIESMAAGIVPIVTDDGSMKLIVEHNNNGIIIEKNNAKALTEQLLILAKDPEKINQLSNNAKVFSANRSSIKNYINNLNNYYKQSVA